MRPGTLKTKVERKEGLEKELDKQIKHLERPDSPDLHTKEYEMEMSNLYSLCDLIERIQRLP